MNYQLIQFHTDSINPCEDTPVSRYYKAIWMQDGYMKPEAFWELPKWAGELSFCLEQNGEDYTFKVLKRAEKLTPDVHIVFGSVLDANKHLFKKLAEINPHVTFILGGYVDPRYFNNVRNVNFYDSIKDAVESLYMKYYEGVSWKAFKGTQCIPRITLSTGCKHKCKFCTIENKVKKVDDRLIWNQIYALECLDFRLIYIDDKTFGQCDNYKSLSYYGNYIRKYMNPLFMGFIVQTTAGMVKKIYWDTLDVYAVEVGVESFNDEILKQNNKPATEDSITTSMKWLNKLGVNFIPNIIIGLPNESLITYSSTYRFLKKAKILHANIYNLALYDTAELSKEINSEHNSDANEMETSKSFYSDEENSLNEAAMKIISQLLLTKIKLSWN